MDQKAFTIKCAWCGKILAVGSEKISHTICMKCCEEVLNELEAMKCEKPIKDAPKK